MHTSTVRFLCLAVLLLGAMGCARHEGAYAPQATTTGNLETKTDFVLYDPGAQRSVTCSAIKHHVLPDGRIEAAANIRNRENRRIEVQVSCVFKDDYGFGVDETPFQTLILSENGTESVTFTSANNKAKKFTFRVRQAR
jgi:hypothetical protein